MLVEVPAVEVRVGGDGPSRHFIEGNVLRRERGSGCHHQRMSDALRVTQRPLQGLHGAQAATHDGGKALDAEAVGQSCLGVHPVLDRDHGKLRAPGFAGGRVDGRRPGRAETAAQVIDADDKEAFGIQGLARADHVVPPADVGRLVFVPAGDVVGVVQCLAHQDRIGPVGVQIAVGFIDEFVGRQHAAAAKGQRHIELHALCPDRPHRILSALLHRQ